MCERKGERIKKRQTAPSRSRRTSQNGLFFARRRWLTGIQREPQVGLIDLTVQGWQVEKQPPLQVYCTVQYSDLEKTSGRQRQSFDCPVNCKPLAINADFKPQEHHPQTHLFRQGRPTEECSVEQRFEQHPPLHSFAPSGTVNRADKMVSRVLFWAGFGMRIPIHTKPFSNDCSRASCVSIIGYNN